MPARIVTHASRPKRAPRKKANHRASAIVTVTNKRDRMIRRREADDEASPEIKAFFARMMRPP